MSASTPSRQNWSGGYYADVKSPIASTPQPQRRTGAVKSTNDASAPLSPMHGPDKRVRAVRQTHHADHDQDDAIFSPPLAIDGPTSAASSVKLSPAPAGRACGASKSSVQRSLADGRDVAQMSLRSPVKDVEATPTALDSMLPMSELDADEKDFDHAALMYEEFNPFLFIKLLPPHRQVVPRGPRIVLPKKLDSAPRQSLVLDLDETLVHCSIEPIPDADTTFSVVFNGMTYQVYVRKRPYLDRFLAAVASKFEVTVFTASQQVYAEKLLDILDPKGVLIHHRLYRDSCLNVEGNFLKDLTVLGRDLSQTVLVDNSPHAFGYQLDNGIPIESWFENRKDKELLKLAAFLDTLLDVPDVRPLVRSKFNLRSLVASA